MPAKHLNPFLCRLTRPVALVLSLLSVHAQAAEPLSAGRVDGFFTLSDAYLLEDKKVGKIIWSSKQAPLDWKMRAELFGASDFVKQQPEITPLVVDAYLKASQWIAQEQNKDEYIKYLTQSGQPESVLLREVQGEPWAAHVNPLIDATLRQQYRDGIAYSLKAKLIRNDITVNDLLDDRFVDQGVKDLKLQGIWTPLSRPATPC
jgi:sulfonate transport system substrate-binding protein